ncbi:MAG TPA: hypothetical protein VF763_08750 [Candidatus Limnocylindrales bacterium]
MKRTLLAVALAGLLAVGSSSVALGATSTSPCQGLLTAMATRAIPAGFWAAGPHTYTVRYHTEGYDDWVVPVDFSVSPAAPLYDEPVYLRMFGPVTRLWTPVADATINPAQATVFWFGLVAFPGDVASRSEFTDLVAASTIYVSIDGGAAAVIPLGPTTNGCAYGFTTPSNGLLHVVGQLHRHYAG